MQSLAQSSSMTARRPSIPKPPSSATPVNIQSSFTPIGVWTALTMAARIAWALGVVRRVLGCRAAPRFVPGGLLPARASLAALGFGFATIASCAEVEAAWGGKAPR